MNNLSHIQNYIIMCQELFFVFCFPPPFELHFTCSIIQGMSVIEAGIDPKWIWAMGIPKISQILMMRGCSTILPKIVSLCFVCHSNPFLPAQLSKACQWSVSAHFKILQGRFPAGKVLPSKQFLIMILKLVVDRTYLCVSDISVDFRITHVCEIMCEY